MSVLFASDYLYVHTKTELDTLYVDEQATLYDHEKKPIHNHGNTSSLQEVKSGAQKDVPMFAYELVGTGTVAPYVNKNHYKSTIGCAFKCSSKIHIGDGQYAKAQFWDTAGQERFRSIGNSYYRGADVVVVVYDVSQGTENVDRWIEECYRVNEELTIVVIGNKTDLPDRRVNSTDVHEYYQDRGIFHTEISAHSGENIEYAFSCIVSASYLNAWKNNRSTYELTKMVIVGDSGVGKTTIFDRLETFECDLTPLTIEFPLENYFSDIPISSQNQHVDRSHKLFRKVSRRADTNILSINLGHLGGWLSDTIATGDPQVCSVCSSIFDEICDFEPESEGEGIWTCEFCGTQNTVFLDQEPAPKEVDYLISGTPQELLRVYDKSLIIFCIDTSGSMCVTSEIPKSLYQKSIFKSKMKETDSESILGTGDAQVQYLPNENRNVMYVSRLDSVKVSIEAQLIKLQQDHPNRKIVLITFSDKVTVYADNNLPFVIQGDMLNDKDALCDISRWWKKDSFDIPPVIKAREFISEKLFSLEEGGQTALGFWDQ
eukprot:TRINITY_DN1152_c0_g1_i1.p1 TRINITY_DN1152_c0_g1~~TRINITY_DN1152_c0_g1_i1.p1  ORF type:complete len:544 (+),score=97.47 TRINITY_DN1152_c0_g1_i1:63-1694(+)